MGEEIEEVIEDEDVIVDEEVVEDDGVVKTDKKEPEVKTFTQEEVNKIVQKEKAKLKKQQAKPKNDDERLAAMEMKLQLYETKELLVAKGLSPELAPLVMGDDMEEKIELLLKTTTTKTKRVVEKESQPLPMEGHQQQTKKKKPQATSWGR